MTIVGKILFDDQIQYTLKGGNITAPFHYIRDNVNLTGGHTATLQLANLSSFDVTHLPVINLTTSGLYDIDGRVNNDLILKIINCTTQNHIGASNSTVDTCPIDLTRAMQHIHVVRSESLIYLSMIIGWIYFAAWTFSFYPQVILNFKRKSVIGLNFDFTALNFFGFFCYSIYNCAFYWSDTVHTIYYEKYPNGVIQVQINDIFFSLHAFLLTGVTIAQCFIYERGGQKVSKVCWVILATFVIFALVSIFLYMAHVIDALNLIMLISYIKLVVSLIKYIPQALMNHKRRSTIGWSIGNVLLDFTGGFMSIIQMFIISYNTDNWSSIFTDFTKFGLGFISLSFDILFILQHYVFYRQNNKRLSDYENIDSSSTNVSRNNSSTNPSSIEQTDVIERNVARQEIPETSNTINV